MYTVLYIHCLSMYLFIRMCVHLQTFTQYEVLKVESGQVLWTSHDTVTVGLQWDQIAASRMSIQKRWHWSTVVKTSGQMRESFQAEGLVRGKAQNYQWARTSWERGSSLSVAVEWVMWEPWEERSVRRWCWKNTVGRPLKNQQTNKCGL